MTKAILTRRPTTMFTDPLFRRLFEGDLFSPENFMSRGNESIGEGSWHPAVDVRETDDAYVFTAELAGLEKKDVDITLEDKVLTISGERSFEGKEENQSYHRIERAYGSFSRSFTLPHEVKQDSVTASFKDGVLSITVPKAEALKPRKIEIS